jgi:2-haloacid dehalogenase
MSGNNQNHPDVAFIFDFGGVLFKWDPFYLYRRFFNNDRAAVDRFLQEIGFSEWNLEQDRGRSFEVAIPELSARFPHYAGLIRAYLDHYEETILGPIEGTVDILHDLKTAGYPLYALSNWNTGTFAIIRPRYPFLEWFDDIVISGDARLVKPDPRIFHLVLERTGRQPQDCIFIDDHLPNIEVAQRLGFRTILFESPSHLSHQLRSLGYLS